MLDDAIFEVFPAFLSVFGVSENTRGRILLRSVLQLVLETLQQVLSLYEFLSFEALQEFSDNEQATLHIERSHFFCSLVFWNFFEILIEKETMKKIRLFVAVRCENQIEKNMLQGLLHLHGIFLDAVGVLAMLVMLTNIEIVLLVQIHLDHQLVVFQFEILQTDRDG